MEFYATKAIYLQIADLICEHILLKRWQAGERVPSVREMAVSIEVNPNTVQRSYSYLQEKGVIQNKRGIGYFVADNAYDLSRALKMEDFLARDCPQFFKMMDLLRLDFDEVRKIYDSQKR